MASALAKEVHKGTEVDDFNNFAVIDLTFFGLGDDCIDHVIGFFDRVTVWRGNFDHALIVDVDLRTRDFDNFAKLSKSLVRRSTSTMRA